MLFFSKHFRRGAFLLRSVLLALGGVGSWDGSLHALPPEGIFLDGVAAQVDETFITASEVMDWLREHDPAAGAVSFRDDAFQARFANARDALIDMQLIVKAFRDSGAQLQPWVIDQRVAEVIENVFQGDRARLLEELARERITFAQWRERIERQVIVASMRYTHAEQPAVATPEAVRTYYEEHYDQFVRQAAVHMRLIVVRPDDASDAAHADARGRIGEAEQALRRGEDFESVARKISQGRHAAAGGDWGWVRPEEDLRSELADALAGLKAGEFSGAIHTAEEYYIVQRVAQRDREPRPLTEVWDAISQRLQQRQSRQLYDAWILRLRNQARIRVFDPA